MKYITHFSQAVKDLNSAIVAWNSPAPSKGVCRLPSSPLTIHLSRTISDLISRLGHLLVLLLLSLLRIPLTRHAILVIDELLHHIDRSRRTTGLDRKYLALLVNNKDTARRALRRLLEADGGDEAL